MSVTVLHPTVLVTATDHHLRVLAGVSGTAPPSTLTTGILFGVQSGQKVEIFTSFEAKVDVAGDGSLKVDAAFVADKIKLRACGGAVAVAGQGGRGTMPRVCGGGG